MRTYSLDCDAVNHFRPNAGAQQLETNVSLHWDHIDDEAVKTAKLLAADAVEQAGSGHPGTAISLAPAAYLLYNKVMNVDPADPRWIGRDRFILSAGHSSLTQYVQLYLSGFGLELDDIKALRTAGSLTPGHPEYGHTKGVEITTGPLGTGIASAVGFAMNARRVHGLLDPETPSVSPSSTTTSTSSLATAASRKASPPRPPPSPAPRNSATSPSSGTTTTSPSKTTPRSPSTRMSWPATRPTAGTSSASTGSARTAPTRKTPPP